MFTLIGAVIGFVAMLAVRGRAGIAAALAVLGLVLGMATSLVVGVDFLAAWVDNPEARPEDPDWGLVRYLAGVMAAAPGVLGAAFARRD
ncbi:MAG: hypothetical protein AAFW46_08340 [Pseudomonadota bacterium]